MSFGGGGVLDKNWSKLSILLCRISAIGDSRRCIVRRGDDSKCAVTRGDKALILQPRSRPEWTGGSPTYTDRQTVRRVTRVLRDTQTDRQ